MVPEDPSSRSTYPPGKLLVIDNVFDSVRPLIIELVRHGITTVFWDPNSEVRPSTTNVRVILTDIDLLGLDVSSENSYEDLALRLKDIQGPFLVIFISIMYDEDSARMLSDAYRKITNTELPGVVLGLNMDKTQTEQVLSKIPEEIIKVLSTNQLFNIILLAEELLNRGTDKLLSDLTRREFENAVRALLYSIVNDTGKESAAREFVVLLSRLVTRNMEVSPQYLALKKVVGDIANNNSSYSAKPSDSWVYYKRMYYLPDKDEEFRTGDIFLTDSGNPIERYAILVTPACDISQDKAVSYTFCFGAIVSEKSIEEEKDHPIYYIDPALNGDKDKARKRYLTGENKAPERIYFLRYFLDEENDYTRTFIVDFQSIHSIRSALFQKLEWKRIIRLDSPYIEDLLQKYGAYAFRLGTPSLADKKS